MSRALRDAFARFATGVVVMTARISDGGWSAVTINSFSSLSLDPPLLSFSLGLTANCRVHFERSGRFAASVLRHDQQWISNRFARPSSSTMHDVPRIQTPQGDLLIANALATFQCREHSRHVLGDHVLFVGLIEAFDVAGPGQPLAFFRGSYGSFTPDQSAAAAYAPPPETAELSLGWG